MPKSFSSFKPAIFIVYGAPSYNPTVHLVNPDDDEKPACGSTMAAEGEWVYEDTPGAKDLGMSFDNESHFCKRCWRLRPLPIS